MESVDIQIKTPLHTQLIGTSPAIREVQELVERVAPSELSILITGETGTGKDLVARMLHNKSGRAQKAFVKVNCPAIQEMLIESELFGHEKGAFTGAATASVGYLGEARGGTLFLDEISEATSVVKEKLLLVLDGEPYIRLGGVKPQQSDVRVIAATNISLDALSWMGKMSEDLLFRIAEVVMQLPALRERPEDIPVLAEHFNFNLSAQYNKPYEALPAPVLEKMAEMPWPGNVRELAGRIKEYVVTGHLVPLTQFDADASQLLKAVAEPDPDPEQAGGPSPEKIIPLKVAVQQAVEQTERALIGQALACTLWNRRKAAKLLGISYSSLLRRIDTYGLGK